MGSDKDDKTKNKNRDSLTGETGSHPVGTAVGGIAGQPRVWRAQRPWVRQLAPP